MMRGSFCFFFLLYLHYEVEKNKNPKKKNYLQTKTASSTEWGRSNVTSSVRNKKEIKIGDIYMCNKSEEINGFWRSAQRFIPAGGGAFYLTPFHSRSESRQLWAWTPAPPAGTADSAGRIVGGEKEAGCRAASTQSGQEAATLFSVSNILNDKLSAQLAKTGTDCWR